MTSFGQSNTGLLSVAPSRCHSLRKPGSKVRKASLTILNSATSWSQGLTAGFVTPVKQPIKVLAKKLKAIELPIGDIVGKAPVNYRPLDNLTNPYPLGCSKLCNHPIDTELREEYKDVLKKAKESSSTDYRTILLPEEELFLKERASSELDIPKQSLDSLSMAVASSRDDLNDQDDDDVSDHGSNISEDDDADIADDEDKIPDELLMKYTAEDTIDDAVDTKTQIVLDLRRSEAEPDPRRPSNPSRVTPIKPRAEPVTTPSQPPTLGPPAPSIVQSHPRSTVKFKDVKKTKKKGKGKTRSESPEKGFFGDYPDDTQVAADDDGDLILTLTPSPATAKASVSTRASANDEEAETDFDLMMEEGSPLERRALTSLVHQIQAERPESDLDIHRLQEQDDLFVVNLRETVRKSGDLSKAEAEIAELDKEFQPLQRASNNQDEDPDFWLHLPRTFSFQSSRFELPLDMSVLTNLTPVEYLSRYVTVSSARRLLYDKVFVRNRSLKDGQLNEETTIVALEEVLGGSLNKEQQTRIWSALGIVLKPPFFVSFNYKQFAGIASFVERILCHEFTADSAQLSTAKAEIEKADFDRLLCKLEGIKIKHEAMKAMLLAIKESGQ